MNYPELRAAVQQYAQNFEASFTENVDLFIRLAESRILLRVRLPKFRKDVATTIPGPPALNNDLLTVPLDFLAPDSLRVLTDHGQVFLLPKDPEFLDECYPDPYFYGEPRFYAYLNETTVRIAPQPDQDYPGHLGYFYQPPSIIDSYTNWVGDHFAHALVTGALVEAAQYMKSEDNLFARYYQAFEKDLAMDLDYAKGRTKKDTYQEPDVRKPI